MSKSMASSEKFDEIPADLDRAAWRRLRQLMKRDGLSWTEFLRRAVQAYDLMYSQAE